MNYINSLKSKRFGIVSALLICVSIYAAYLWRHASSAEQFRNAMERRDFRRAEELWNRGIRAPVTDPYAQFMRIKDNLQKVGGVQVTDWDVRKLQTLNETNRYAGLLDIQDSDGAFNRFGIGLEWQGEKWLLKHNPLLPSYVKQCVDQGAPRKESGLPR